MDKMINNKKVVGIKNKNSGFVSALNVVDDVASHINEIRAAVKDKPCAYNLFPEKYAFVVYGIGDEESVIEFQDGHHE